MLATAVGATQDSPTTLALVYGQTNISIPFPSNQVAGLRTTTTPLESAGILFSGDSMSKANTARHDGEIYDIDDFRLALSDLNRFEVRRS
jgi:hypothetical protein